MSFIVSLLILVGNIRQHSHLGSTLQALSFLPQPYRPPRLVTGIALLFLYISIPSSQTYR
jgi:hypothetical protein